MISPKSSQYVNIPVLSQKKVGVIHSFFYRNIVLPVQTEYFYFSADFRLKIF